MAINLPLLHKPQRGDGYCLPACVQMIFAYLGMDYSQEVIGKKLGLNPPLGTSHSNIQKLTSFNVRIVYETGSLTTVRDWVNQGVPVIVFVQAGELPYWLGHHFQHAILVVGIDAQTVYVMDPALDTGPTRTDEESFMLAWSGMDYYYAVLTR
jgi:ABC-type bacteriocin/lantibiotic exporter with double-glycine peptidase domain